MPRTLTLRRRGSSFIETIETEETALSTKRRYAGWEQVDKRLREVGLASEEVLRLKAAFDSGADAALIRLPYRPGDAINII
jgi:hypothetical protein